MIDQLLLNIMEAQMLVPNYQHHSKKAQKRTLKPQAIRAAKKRTKSLIKQLTYSQSEDKDA